MTNWLNKKRVNVLLGLSFEAGRVEGSIVRKANGGCDASTPFSFSLVGDIAKMDPQVVGEELRKQLDSCNIHERSCVVALPSDWVLSCQSEIPELPEEDIVGYLELEAERGFAYSTDELIICRSQFKSPSGLVHVTQIGVPRENVEHLEQVLRVARLTPVSFTIGLCAGFGSSENAEPGVLNLVVNESSFGFFAETAGGVSVIRSLQLPPRNSENNDGESLDMMGRELRMTLGQLPAEVRTSLKVLRLIGDQSVANQLGQSLAQRSKSFGLELQRNKLRADFGLQHGHSGQTNVIPAMLLAAKYISGAKNDLEFLPPRLSAWKQFSTKYSSKKLVYTGVVAGAMVAIVSIAFLIQQFQLSGLRSRWSALRFDVESIERMQQDIKKFRPWYDDSMRHLSIMRLLTEAFPEEGTVIAKSLEIHEGGMVICAGTANDHASLLKMLDRLRVSTQISEVQVDQLRGKSPLQFTFNFQWLGKSANL